MNLYPEEYKDEMPKVLDWFDDRACIRKGSWLGTEFPFKKGWIIEPISDSTLYPAYYIVSKYVNENKIKPEDMTEEFFDYVFLGKGKTKNKVWNEIKSDFDYWYPVNINLGGKEHKTVHFPVFLMNHVAVMPKDKWPDGIFVHWWVTQKGKEKISKSKGGVEHINEAATVYGVDAMRLYYAHIGSPFVDVEWDKEVVTRYKNRVVNTWKLIKEIEKIRDKTDDNLDSWLRSMMNRTIKRTVDSFENFDLRVATNEVFFEFQKNIQWYIKRGGGNKKLLKEIISNWVKLMSPVTPHLSEELWSSMGGKDFVSLESYPAYTPKALSVEAEVGERLLSDIVEDISEILKVTKIKPKKICIYISPKWKQDLFKKALKLQDDGKLEMNVLMKTAMADTELRKQGKAVSSYAGKILGEIKKLNENDRKRYGTHVDEKTYLENGKKFLKDEFSADIEIYSVDDKKIYDPAEKARYAVPLRPAIYVE
jgi:leucyl-tRNA synthetase